MENYSSASVFLLLELRNKEDNLGEISVPNESVNDFRYYKLLMRLFVIISATNLLGKTICSIFLDIKIVSVVVTIS